MVKALIVCALFLGGCATKPEVHWFASDPRYRYGWENPRLLIEGHPQRPPDPKSMVKVVWRFR